MIPRSLGCNLVAVCVHNGSRQKKTIIRVSASKCQLNNLAFFDTKMAK